MTKVALGGVWHETNSFVPETTGIDQFRQYQFACGPDLLRIYDGTGTELGGAMAAAHDLGMEIAPLAFAAAVPSGMVTRDAFEQIRDTILRQLAGYSLDGIVLTLHGAMVVDGYPDPEVDLVAAVREFTGNIPVGITLDLHGNLSPALMDAVDVIVAYDTFPHVDMAERGTEVLRLVGRMISTGERPRAHLEKLPLLTVPQMQDTREEPMQSLMAALHDVERRDDVWTASMLPGYPYCSTRRLGFSVYVAADAEPADLCRCLANQVWQRRADFTPPELLSPREAVRAAATDGGPVVLVDVADNVGGGSPGNGTVLLHTLEERGGRDGVVVLWDPDAVAKIYESTDEVASLEVGDASSDALGEPVKLFGMVSRFGHVVYRRSGPYMRGQPVDMGRVAVVESPAGRVVLTERRVMPFDDDHLRVLGIEPRTCRIIVAKSASAWKAAFGGYAARSVFVRTPGYCSSDLRELNFSSRPYPAYPLEEDTSW